MFGLVVDEFANSNSLGILFEGITFENMGFLILVSRNTVNN